MPVMNISIVSVMKEFYSQLLHLLPAKLLTEIYQQRVSSRTFYFSTALLPPHSYTSISRGYLLLFITLDINFPLPPLRTIPSTTIHPFALTFLFWRAHGTRASYCYLFGDFTNVFWPRFSTKICYKSTTNPHPQAKAYQ